MERRHRRTNHTHQMKLDIVYLRKRGFNNSATSRILSEKYGREIKRTTVSYWVNKHDIGVFGEIEVQLPPKERKFKTATDFDKDMIMEQYHEKENTFSSTQMYHELKAAGSQVSKRTTLRVIASCGLTNRGIRYGQMVRDVNKEKRVAFCQQLLAINEKFDDVVFSDETSIQLTPNKVTSYRPLGALSQTIPKAKHPLKLHCWGAISKRGPSPLVIFDGIMNADFSTENILGDTLLPFLRTTFPDGHIFQQDNDPKHNIEEGKTVHGRK